MLLLEHNSLDSRVCSFSRAIGAVVTLVVLARSYLAPVRPPVAGHRREVWVIVQAKDRHPEEHKVGLPVLLVAGGVDDEVEAALYPEEGRENEEEVRVVIDVFAPDELVNYDGHVANEVSHADGANGLGHAMVTCGKLVAHVVAEKCSKVNLLRHTLPSKNWFSYLESRRYVEEFRTILHSPILQQNIVQNGNMRPNV